ncbi:MAG: hypothetical protein JNL54_03370 [Kineosporiaceae bacterium]|nr:hypothetical protein [Kineosporiaceae bacterium]
MSTDPDAASLMAGAPTARDFPPAHLPAELVATVFGVWPQQDDEVFDLAVVRRLAELRRVVERQLADAVADARLDAAAWSAIAAALGTTRQAAHQRYSSHPLLLPDPPVPAPGDPPPSTPPPAHTSGL